MYSVVEAVALYLLVFLCVCVGPINKYTWNKIMQCGLACTHILQLQHGKHVSI